MREVTTSFSDSGAPSISTVRMDGRSQTIWFSYDARENFLGQTQSDWHLEGGSPTSLANTSLIYDFSSEIPFQTLARKEVYGIDPESQQWALQGKTEYFYDQYAFGSGQVHTGVTNHNGDASYANRGNLTTVRSWKNASIYVESHLEYDNLGNVVRQIDPLGNPASIVYGDSYAYPVQTTNALNQTTGAVYNHNTGLVTRTTDVRQQNTDTTYDEMNRPLTITEPGGRVTSIVYDDATPKVHTDVKADSSKWLRSETVSDKMGRPTREIQVDPVAGNVYVDTQYDADGRVWKVSQAYRSGENPVWTTTTYDALDRPIATANPDGSQVTMDYTMSAAGPAVTQTDEAGNPRRMTHDALGHLVKVEEPNPTLSTPAVTDYTYYVSGALHKVVQSGAERTFTRNWLGQLLSESHPESGTTLYDYYADGSLQSRTDARGAGFQATYTYDALGRLKTASYADATPGVTYSYDENTYTGLLTSVVTAGVTSTAFQYNSAGLQTSEQITLSGVSGTFTAAYGYDYAGRLTQITHPSGRVVTRSYASSGDTAVDRISTITDGPTSATLLSGVVDNAAGQITARTLGGVVAESRGYNTRNQATGITASAGGAAVLNLGYGYGPLNNGRIRTRTDALQPEHSADYSYDAMNRLAGVAGNAANWGISWNLDIWGNRTSQAPSGLAVSKVGQQTSGYANNRNIAFGYDDAGDVTSDGLHTYAYDAEGRIKSVDGGAVQFAYDDQGRRIRKSAGSVTTYYFYGLTGLMSEFTTTPGATSAASTDRLQYRVAEQTGTAVLLLSSAGTVLENNRVLPYGELWSNFFNSSNDQKFTTYDREAVSGLDYAMARFYANRNGRFTSPDPGHVGADPSNPQSWNAYTYGVNDPINTADPEGLDYYFCGIGIGCGGSVGDNEFYRWLTSNNIIYTGNGDLVSNGIFIGSAYYYDPFGPPVGQRGIQPEPTTPQVDPTARFIQEMDRRAKASENLVYTAEGASVVAGAVGGAVAASGVGSVVIDGISYTYSQLAQLGQATLLRLLAAGKITADVYNRIMTQIYFAGVRAADYLFARSTGLLNGNSWLGPYFRIGWGWKQSIQSEVFRISIGGKGLPIWKHIDLFERK